MLRLLRPAEELALADSIEPIVDRAIGWALERLGSAHYASRCLSFVEDAYEQANDIEVFGGSSARESANIYGVSASAGQPPRGAFVFYGTSGPIDGVVRDWGHVGLATADGRLIHAWPEVRIDDLSAVPGLESGDWSALSYLGWAPPARILSGARFGRPRR